MKIYHVKKKESLRENIRSVLPEMYDGFMLLSDIIINYPLRKNDLHEMRKLGKPLRYTMELGEYCFGDEFKNRLDDVKDVLELMGEVHDADVMIPEINLHIKEIRLFNQTIPDFKQRFQTKALRNAVTGLRTSRKEMYMELCKKLNEWKQYDFKSILIASMDK